MASLFQNTEKLINPSCNKNELIASPFPTHQGLGFAPYLKYENYWYPEHLLKVTMAIKDTFKARSSDIILATVPKSGTTWLKAIIFCIINRQTYSVTNHPLLNSSPHDCFPFLHSIYENNNYDQLESMKDPRLLAVHSPFSSLPDSVTESDCRIIYLCRDPKDAFVSLRHYLANMRPDGCKMTPFSEAFDLFCAGVSPFGPFWANMLEYWKESIKNPQKVIFVKYENLMEDTIGNVKQLGEFLGCPFSDEEEKRGVLEEIVELCSFKKMKGVKANKEGEHGTGLSFKNSAFFRKGKVGDWRKYMTIEMGEKLDEIVKEKLHGSGLTF
ncbi:hypothetical protein LUZ60_016667 [Juncus effusus]|nr:hypothetical protein LUZ60_016667 [Juncus effusus]